MVTDTLTCRHRAPAVPVEVAFEDEPVNWLCPDCGTERPEPIIQIENPYWNLVSRIPGDEITTKYHQRWEPASYPPMSMLSGNASDRSKMIEEWYETKGRSALVVRYAWAIPSPDTLRWVIDALDDRSVVEIGAGTGYWAWMLDQLGVDITAYDSDPPLAGENSYHCRDGNPGTQYFPVQKGGVESLAIPDNHERALFLSWPPYNTSMAHDALKAYRGDMLIEIGEGEWGCTGDDDFYSLLGAEWNDVDTGPLVQWSGLHDRITLWRRK